MMHGLNAKAPVIALLGLLVAWLGLAAPYRARLAYLLYPRRIQVLADSAAALGDCGYFVVFRDTEQNLAAEPFAGSWNQQDLERRLASLETVAVTSLARIYRTP
jgi:hypothetical protein